jgi:heat shock protein 4
MGGAADAEAAKDENGDINMTGSGSEPKTAVVFPAGSQTNVVKLLTFYRKAPFEITARYGDDSPLAPGTSADLGVYKVEMPPSAELKKVKVKAKLNIHGLFLIDGAQILEEEEYEETVKEKRELPEDPIETEETKETDAPGDDAESPPAEGETTNGDKPDPTASKETPKVEPKYEWIDVVKKRKRTKRTELTVTATGTPGLSSKDWQTLADEETAIQSDMRNIIETDEKRNDLEGYILNTRDKISSSGEHGDFISASDRDKFMSDLQKAEDWLYDNFEASKLEYEDKLGELKEIGDPIAWRFNENSMRDDWIGAVEGTIKNYKQAAENGGEKYCHIDTQKLESISRKCNDVQRWLEDLKGKQAKLPKTEKPVLLCAEMEKQNQALAKFADEILKEPRPAPPKKDIDEKKVEEKAEEKPAEEPVDEAEPPQNMDVD